MTMVVPEGLAAIVANLEKELICFRTHVPLFSELLIEISRDVNVDLNVVSEVLLALLDHMQKHLNCCWKLLRDFYKKVAQSLLPSPFFRNSNTGEMPQKLVEMLANMAAHMVRFRRVCESCLKCHSRHNSGYSRSLHLAATNSVTTTKEAMHLVRHVSVRVLRLSSKDVNTEFGLRCRLSSSCVIEVREKLKLGEMEALQRRIRSAALLWNRRRKAQLRIQRKPRLQNIRNNIQFRLRQVSSKTKLLKLSVTRQTQQPRAHRVTRSSVVVASELESSNDNPRDKPAHHVTGGGTSNAKSKDSSAAASSSSVRRLTEPCNHDSPAFQPRHGTKKRGRSHSVSPRVAVGVHDECGGSSATGITSHIPKTRFSADLRRQSATLWSAERSGSSRSPADREGSCRLSTGGKSEQLVPPTSNKRRKSDSKGKSPRTQIRFPSVDDNTNCSSPPSLLDESVVPTATNQKIVDVKTKYLRSQNLIGSSPPSHSSPQPSITVGKKSPVSKNVKNVTQAKLARSSKFRNSS